MNISGLMKVTQEKNASSIFSRLALAAVREIFKHYRMLDFQSDNVTNRIILSLE